MVDAIMQLIADGRSEEVIRAAIYRYAAGEYEKGYSQGAADTIYDYNRRA